MEYQHGGDVYSQEIWMDYSANLNPLGLPEAVYRALLRAAGDCSRYPDSQSRRLRAALGERCGVPAQWLVCGNGAADLIFSLVLALKPARAVVPAPTFSEYEQALTAVQCHTRHFYLKEEDGFQMDVPAFCRFLRRESGGSGHGGEREGARMAFLCNPNNPTGLPLSQKEVRQVADTCAEEGIFLAVDECFCDFLEEPESASLVPILKGYPNVMILKAFTKTYAMAGIRLGYGICPDGEVLEKLNRVRQPWSVSALAQEAGLAALGEEEYVAKARAVLSEEREFLRKGLEKLGFRVWPSKANYLFFRDERKIREKALYERLRKRGVLVRSCGNYPGLDGRYYRICVKCREENQVFLRELKEALEE